MNRLAKAPSLNKSFYWLYDQQYFNISAILRLFTLCAREIIGFQDYPISMQNLVIDERHAYNRIRTVGQTSVQTENENLFRQDGFRGLFGSAWV